ncbi:excinuclease ABC subunit UvrC [Alloscardovia macacae]|uniref:UvrABC system protein C n=1 Tax=Alloscardovia macacae TaxID=1160091 RepID=A0A261F6G6_9BIFI|nr:excinuclease ABC subunit UvrC [Alloscardovia macacae]OZG54486.1 excinuclease ABC subunit C [Alloscardovia macacae]
MDTAPEKYTQGAWRKTVRLLHDAQSDGSLAVPAYDTTSSEAPEEVGVEAKTNVNGAPLLGDTRDLFRPKTSDIPTNPGVYKWRDGDGRVIYVGKAKNLRNRLTNYFQPLERLHPRTQNMVLTARSLEWTVVGTELESLTLEYTWIKEFDPRFNVVFRDDKTYPYVAISVKEEIPRVWVTRNKNNRKARYFGPYAKVWNMRQTLDSMLRAYPVRTCTPAVLKRAQETGRPCLLGHIGKCSAPCVGWISKEEHRSMSERLVAILTGRLGDSFRKQLESQMKEASAELEFEKAAKIRDQIQALSSVLEQNSVVFSTDVDADVIGIETDELEASVHSFFVRAGTIRGERGWSVERVEDVDDAELLADLITQVYSAAVEENDSENIMGISSTEKSSESISVTASRDALAPTQQTTATDAVRRAQVTRHRKEREDMTGRSDLLAPISPIPREILVPFEPARLHSLEMWLSGLRGAIVTIRVAERGEKKTLLDRANANAQQSLQRSKLSRVTDLAARSQALHDIADALYLDQAPLRIECYDISNATGGGFQVASMVVFEDGMAKKNFYRHFAIRGKDGKGAIDDTAAIYETLTRRFSHGNISGDTGDSLEDEARLEKLEQTQNADSVSDIVQQDTSRRRFAYKPNLIVVDGGQPQVKAAQRALDDCGINDVAVCGLAKKLEEVWVADDDYPIILKRQSEGMYLLQRVRDESHRFAITYHRKTRRKGALRSALDDIPGIGPSFQKKLLNHFGSVRAMREATVEDFLDVPGVGHAKADALYAALHSHKEDVNEHTASHNDINSTNDTKDGQNDAH